MLYYLALVLGLVACSLAAPSGQLPLQSLDRFGPSQQPGKSAYHRLPGLKEQDAMEKRWLRRRYERVGEVLRKYGYDALLISEREYAEDTMFRSLVSSTTTFSARRRTVHLFHAGNATELEIASPTVWIDNTPAVWDELNRALEKINPGKIAVNIDPDLAFADGLHTGEGRTLLGHLDKKWASRVSSERMIPVEVIAYRSGGEEQLEMYKLMMENVWAMIEESFSEAIVKPGETTANDLEWWFRAKMQDMNVTTWFHPTVNVFGPNRPGIPFGTDHGNADGPIQEGEMLHVDIGITAMNMNTDTQHLAYVLRKNETTPPAGLVAGLKASNHLQDLVRKHMKLGRTGDDVLHAVRSEMKEEGAEGLIYCHPIGDFGHAAGALIGMTNLQEGVPIGGALPLLEDAWFSVELAAHSFVPEWNVTQSFMQEEDVYWSEKTQGWEWVRGRQERFHLVRT